MSSTASSPSTALAALGALALCVACAPAAEPASGRPRPEEPSAPAFPADAPVETRTDSEPVGERHRVALIGHLYSLFSRHKIMNRKEPVFTEDYLEALADDLRELDPEMTFFLGDNTRYSMPVEFELLDRVLDGVGGQKVWVAGNHDYKDYEEFEAFGGIRNAAYVLGNSKFIALDCKTVFEEHDLEFLDRELADWQEYDNVFIVMHYILVQYKEAEEGLDPYKAYTGMTNWNSAVVPRIAGKVKYVFSGDYHARQVGRIVQSYQGHEIHYIRNSILFRRGRGDDTTGDGPIVYVVLEFEDGGEFSILPRMLPVDVRDSWYRNFVGNARGPALEDFGEYPEEQGPWRTYRFQHGLTIELPMKWAFTRGKGELLMGATEFAGGLGSHMRIHAYPNRKGATVDTFREKHVEQLVAESDGALRVREEGELTVGEDLRVLWSLAEREVEGGTLAELNAYFLGPDRAFWATFTTTDPALDYRLRLMAQTDMFRIVDRFRVAR